MHTLIHMHIHSIFLSFSSLNNYFTKLAGKIVHGKDEKQRFIILRDFDDGIVG